MNWPGEALLYKMWESLVDKGIGGLLQPWQMRRIAAAEIEIKQIELIAVADADRLASSIRDADVIEGKSADAAATLSQLYQRKLVAVSLRETARREVNTAHAIVHAEEQLRNDPQQPPTESVDEDWLHRWRDYASDTSKEELQNLWGRLLAGEVKSPGSFTLRTLEFIKNLSVKEANQIADVLRFSIDNGHVIVREDNILQNAGGLTVEILAAIEGLGVIAGTQTGGFNYTWSSGMHDRYYVTLRSQKQMLMIEHPDPGNKLSLSVILVQPLGVDLKKLSSLVAHEKYVRAIGILIKKKGYKVSMCECVSNPNDKVVNGTYIDVVNREEL